MGVIAALLIATGHLDSIAVPLWVKLACGAALTLGTAMGGWRIVRTIGRRIFRLAPLDGFASQSASTAVILAASYLGAPVSTTQVVASSVVGVGGGRRRWHHVRWAVVRSIGFAWLLTLPATAALGAVIARDLEGARMSRAHGSCRTAPTCSGCCASRRRSPSRAMDALVAWAGGDAAAADRVRDCEHRADERKRALREALTVAFTTPLEPEDLFELSTRPRHGAERREEHRARGRGDGRRARRGDRADGDAAGRGAGHLADAFASTRATRTATARAADARSRASGRLERVYREAMSALVQDSDLREVAARRELYRRLPHERQLVEVAERVWYSVLKQR